MVSREDPTPDVPRGVVNWPRQRQVLEIWAEEHSTYSDMRGYMSGAITRALEYLDMFAKDNADCLKAIDKLMNEAPYCHAAQDGDCAWKGCLQIRDGEPEATGRHCPLDHRGEENAF